MKTWYRRWMLKRIIMALQEAVEHHGLKKQTVDFCRALESTYDMTRGLKSDTEVMITCTKAELVVFLSYMIQLHNSKLSLLTRARIGLITLLINSNKLMPGGQDPLEFAQQQFAGAKSAKDDNQIIQINK